MRNTAIIPASGNGPLVFGKRGGVIIPVSKPGMLQVALAPNTNLITTNNEWGTYSELTDLGSKNWYDIAVCASNPLVQTAVVLGGYIYTTTDGWKTFTEVANQSLRLGWLRVAISPSNPLVQTAVDATSNTGYIWVTTDGWATYERRGVSRSSQRGPVVISNTDPMNQFLCVTGDIHSTTNGWATSTSTYIASGVNTLAACPSDIKVQTAGSDAPGYLYTSTNKGVSFTVRSNAGTLRWKSIAIAATNSKIQTAVPDGDYIHTTTNGWSSFTKRTGPGSRSWYSVAISPTDPLVQTALARGGYIYTTVDGWTTFAEHSDYGAKDWLKVIMT